MMKKLLVLTLVLVMAPMASALTITVNGVPTSQITLRPSDTVEIDLELDAAESTESFVLALELSNNQAELLWGEEIFPLPAEAWNLGAKSQNVGPQYGEITGAALTIFGEQPIVGPSDLAVMQGLYLHCLEETDVILTVTTTGVGGNIWNGETIGPGVEVARLYIEQIPEPATMALLGLGGLFLVRRRRK
jgi:hypothetical protein